MNQSLQMLRFFASQPVSAMRHRKIGGLLSASAAQPWAGVVIHYAEQHGLLRAEDALCLRLQHEAIAAHRPWHNPIDDTEMIWIPPGPFWAGIVKTSILQSPQREYIGETVVLDGFSMARYPITNGQYARFVEATGYRSPLQTRWAPGLLAEAEEDGIGYPTTSYLKHWTWSDDHSKAICPPELLDHPVVYVSWFDAQMYCRWAGLILPSEWMWEKAARGTDRRVFPWGDRLMRSEAPLAQVATGGTCPVYEHDKTRSAYGCKDMLGNVSELCELAEACFAPDGEGLPSLTPKDAMPWVRPDISFLSNARRWGPHRGSNYCGFVRDNVKVQHPMMRQIGFLASRNTACHSPWCGFRPAFLPR